MFSPVSILVVTALSSVLSILVLTSLRSHAIDGVPRWIWLEASRSPADWSALRRALLVNPAR